MAGPPQLFDSPPSQNKPPVLLDAPPKGAPKLLDAPPNYNEDTYKSYVPHGYQVPPIVDKLNPIISKYAKKYGVDERIARAIVQVESSGGRDPNTNGSGGVMQVTQGTAAQYGIDAAHYHTLDDPEVGVEVGMKVLRDAYNLANKDPYRTVVAYNAGPGYINDKIESLSPTTQAYIGKMYANLNQPAARRQPVEEAGLGDVVKPVTNLVQRVASGKHPGGIVYSAPQMQSVKEADQRRLDTLNWIHDHLLEVPGDVMDAARRATVSGAVGIHALIDGKQNVKQVINTMMNDIFHPDPLTFDKLHRQEQPWVNTIATAAHGGVPSHWKSDAEIDHMVDHEGWGPHGNIFGQTVDFRSHMKLGLKATRDFLEDSMSDPSTLFGEAAMRAGVKGTERIILPVAGRAASAAAQAAKFLADTAAEHNMGYIHGAYNVASKVLNEAGRFMHGMFGERPDLDRIGASSSGKKVIMQVENKHLNKAEETVEGFHTANDDQLHATHRQTTTALANKAFTATAKEIREAAQAKIAKLNPKTKAAEIAKINRSTAQKVQRAKLKAGRELADKHEEFEGLDRSEKIKRLSWGAFKTASEDINKELEYLDRNSPAGLLKSGSQFDWSKHKNVNELADELFNTKVRPGETPSPWQESIQTGLNALKFFKNRAKAQIIFDGLPHSFGNVGWLSYMGSGPRVLMRAMTNLPRLIADKAFASQVEARLADTGAHSAATHGATGGLGSWERQGLKGMQKLNDLLEKSWRYGHLQLLDEAMPKESRALMAKVENGTASAAETSKHQMNEYLKGYMASQKAGDYRHISNAVRLFSAIGGWYPIFRLGILPKQVVKSFIEDPRRLIASERWQQEIQNNRQGKGQNYLVLSGAQKDVGELAVSLYQLSQGDPRGLSYFINPATSGEAGAAATSYGQTEYGGQSPPSWITMLSGVMQMMLPELNLATSTTNEFTHGLPGQITSFADGMLMAFLHNTVGSYATGKDKEYTTGKQQRREDKSTQAELNK